MLLRPALLALFTFAAACRTASVRLPVETLEALRASPGAYLAGRLVGVADGSILEQRDFAYTAAFSPDGEAVAFTHLGAAAYRLSLFSLMHTEAPRWDVPLNPVRSDVEALAFSWDGAQVATASRDGTVRLLDVATGAQRAAVVLEDALVAVALHPGGRWLVAGGARGGLTVLRLPELRPVREAPAHGDEVRALAFRPDGTLVSGSWDRTVALWGLVETPRVELTLQRRHIFRGHVNDLALDAAGERMAVAFSEEPARRTHDVYRREKKGVVEPLRPENAAAVLEVDSGRELFRDGGHRGVVSTAALTPDGQTLLSGGWDKTLRVTPLGAKAPLATRRFGWSVRRVRVSQDGRRAVVAAWTPQNPLGDQKSDPAVSVFELVYARPEVRAPPLTR